MVPKICPPDLIEFVEKECVELIKLYSAETGILNVSLGFVTAGGFWRFDDRLKTGRLETVGVELGGGYCGLCLKLNQVLIYPSDEQYSAEFLSLEKNHTRLEIAAPVLYMGQPSGVLLADAFQGDPSLRLDYEQLRGIAKKYSIKLSQLLEGHKSSEASLSADLGAIVKNCLKETTSKRGYIAIKTRDGDLRYFDNDNQSFLLLSQTEGLCGAVFKNGALLNVPDVWKHPQYLASDPEIRAEIVVPIKDGSETVGVLNMESSREAHFGTTDTHLSKYGEATLRAASRATALVLAFRRLTLGDSPVIDVAQELMQYDGPIVGDDFPSFVAERLRLALRAERSCCWMAGEDNPVDFYGEEWEPRRGVQVHVLDNEHWVISGSIRSFGNQRAVVGIVAKKELPPTDFHTVAQVCRIAGEILEVKRQQITSRQMESLVEQILISPNSVTLSHVVRDLTRIVGADHCTLYGVVDLSQRNYLIVVASTSSDILRHNHSEMYYKVGLQDDGFYDGYTGFAASTKEIFHTASFSGMSNEEKRTLLERKIKGKRGMSESGQALIAAFMCYPIVDKNQNLLGVLRISRSKAEGKSGDFDQQSRERIRLVSNMLARCYDRSGFFPE